MKKIRKFPEILDFATWNEDWICGANMEVSVNTHPITRKINRVKILDSELHRIWLVGIARLSIQDILD